VRAGSYSPSSNVFDVVFLQETKLQSISSNKMASFLPVLH
jgi:hypothetical protein